MHADRGRDLAALALLLLLAVLLWPVTPAPAGIEAAPPSWGGFMDLVLEGPDAGEWAMAVARMADLEPKLVDHHRMPTWPLLAGMVTRFLTGDVVLAGHLVNRGAFLVAGLATWLGGRLLVGPGTGLLAGSLVLTTPHLLRATERFGIDAAVTAGMAVALAAGLVAARRPRLSSLAGVVAAACGLLHFMMLPQWLPPLVTAVGSARQRLRVAAGMGGGLVVSMLLAPVLFHLPEPYELAIAVDHGIAPQLGQQVDAGGLVEDVTSSTIADLGPGLIGGLGELIDGLRGDLPAALFAAALAAGLLLPPLLARLQREDWQRPALAGLGIATALAPLPVLHAAGAPERYTHNLVPVAAVLCCAGLGAALRRLPRVGPWAELVVPAALAVALVARDRPAAGPPTEQVVGSYLLEQAVEAHVPEGAPVVVPAREIAFAARRAWCLWPTCIGQVPLTEIERCMEHVRISCDSTRPLGWVAMPGWQVAGAQAAEVAALDAWVAEHGGAPAATIDRGPFQATLWVLPAVPGLTTGPEEGEGAEEGEGPEEAAP